MRKRGLILGLLVAITFSIYISDVAFAANAALPESFTKQVTLRPAVTITIAEDDMDEALKKLNTLHGQMAEKGRVLFHLMEFIDDEDFKGFIVTYKSK
jgi:hypothetical protein